MSRSWKPLPTHLPGWHTYAPPEISAKQRERNRKKLLALKARIKEKQRIARAKRNSEPKRFTSAPSPASGERPAFPYGTPNTRLATGVGIHSELPQAACDNSESAPAARIATADAAIRLSTRATGGK